MLSNQSILYFMSIIKIISLIVALYLLFVALGYLFQRYIIYRPSHDIPKSSESRAIDMTVVGLKSGKGLLLKSWYKRAVEGQPTLIYFQGNMGDIGDRAPLIRPYLDKGIGVLLVGYRGYGGNPGRPTEKGLYDDAQAAWDYLRQQQIPSRCIVVYGESIGAALAIELATERSVAATILQSPFTSLVELGKYHYPIFPIDWILKDRYLNNNKMGKINSPLLMLIAREDRIVPVSQSRRLFELANRPKEIKFYEGVGHNEIHPLVQQDVIKFIGKHVTHCGDKRD